MLPYVGKVNIYQDVVYVTYVGKVNIYQDVVYVNLCR